MITAEALREIMDYEPDTGLFRWRDTFAAGACSARRPGDRALMPRPGQVITGTKNGSGYVVISLYGRSYYFHRLAWLHVHGAFPAKGLSIDHINGKAADNRLCNLRVGTHAQNLANVRLIRTNNTSGYRGVSWHPQNREWRASIWCDGKSYHSKTYKNILDAVKWRDAKAKELHGEFARLNEIGG